jgi:16S rRNA (cytosine1402-N4)-methyltransferase
MEWAMFKHDSVFLDLAVDMLNVTTGSFVVDATAGGGGHTQKLLQKVEPSGFVIAIDQDAYAISHLKQKFEQRLKQEIITIKQMNFSLLSVLLKDLDLMNKIDGIVLDLGVSSPQLDTPERGFSFSKEGILDMRMNQDEGLSLLEWLKTVKEADLANVIYEFGEERKSRVIAKTICKIRESEEIKTTTRLADIIGTVIKNKSKIKRNPATKTFQALRIYINRELDHIRKFLDECLDFLKPGGRLAVISFHSLEDRIIKRKMKYWASGLDPDQPMLSLMNENFCPKVKIIKPFPVKITSEEIDLNFRSRSAKLRVCEKI